MGTENLKSIHNVKQLYDEISRADYVSFDVFDTLLLRNVLQPIDLFKIVEVNYERKFNSSIAFSEARIQAEMSARAKTNKEDITFDEIYIQLEEKIGEEAANRCKAIELNLEEQFLIANTDMKAIFDFAIASNKKVLILSDMYLSSDFIGSILTKCGFSGKYDLYVSSELNATKATGTLYKWVKNKYSIEETKKWIHIGDNKGADIKNAKRNGINTYYYKRLAEREQQYYKKSNYSIGYSIMSSVQINNKYLNKKDNYWYDFGIATASSIYYHLVRWLISQIQNKNHIYFLGRDGYIPYKIYSFMSVRNSNLPKADYLMASRRAYVYPTLLNMSQDEALDFLLLYNASFDQRLVLKDILNNLGLQAENYSLQMTEHSVDVETVVNEQSTNAIKSFLKQIWKDIIEQLTSEKEALFKYFETKGMLDAPEVNVFDIGWAGSTQLAIKQLLQKKVNGYYFATHENVKEEIRQDVTSYLFHLGSPLPLRNRVLHYVMMYEFLFSAPTESLIKFTLDKHGEPISSTKNVESNTVVYEAIEAILSGAFHAIKAFEYYEGYMDSLTEEEALYAFQTLIEKKNVKDLLAFSSLTNSVGIGDTDDIQSYVGVYELEDYLEGRSSITTQSEAFLWRQALLIKTDDGRSFTNKEIQLLYNLKTGQFVQRLKKLIKLALKAIRHPKKAIKKAINIVMALMKK